MRYADGVADRHLVGAEVAKPLGSRCHLFDRHGTFVRTPERRREVRTNAQPFACRVARDLRVRHQRLRDALVDVLPAEALRGGGEDRDLGHARRDRPPEPRCVRDERRVLHAWHPADAGEDLPCVGHLWHPAGTHERADLDDRQSGVAERVDQGDLRRHIDRRLLVLQAISGPDLDDAHVAGKQRADHVISTSVTPGRTSWPSRQWMAVTTPSRGARMGSSIFIASSISTGSPALTA